MTTNILVFYVIFSHVYLSNISYLMNFLLRTMNYNSILMWSLHAITYSTGCTKLRNEIETQGTKRNETKYYATKYTKMRNETKRNETKYCATKYTKMRNETQRNEIY